MSALVQTIIPQAFVGSLSWWYYDVRIGWLGMTYFDRRGPLWREGALKRCIFRLRRLV